MTELLGIIPDGYVGCKILFNAGNLGLLPEETTKHAWFTGRVRGLSSARVNWIFVGVHLRIQDGAQIGTIVELARIYLISQGIDLIEELIGGDDLLLQ